MNKLVTIFIFFFVVNCCASEGVNEKNNVLILAFTHPTFVSCEKILISQLLSFSGDRLLVSIITPLELNCTQGVFKRVAVESQINRFLKKISFNNPVKFHWKGAHKVEFKKSTHHFMEHELFVLGKTFLNQELSLLGAKEPVITMQNAKETPIPGSNTKLLKIEFGAGCKLSHKTCLHFYFVDSTGKQYQRKRWYEVNALLPVGVATHSLLRGTEVDVNNCVIKYVRLSLLPGSSVPNCKLLEYMVTQNRYLLGQVFELSRLSPLPVVKKGDIVNMSIKRGSVIIHAEGIAWASAQLGDLVLVSLKESHLTFLARVDGKGRVVVDEI